MEKQWSELTPEEKRDIRFKKWLASEDVKFSSPEAKKRFQERETRVDKVIRMQIPDRVPIWLQDVGFFPAKYTGKTFKDMMYSPETMSSSFKKLIYDFQPDLYWPITMFPGQALDILKSKQVRWPGGDLGPNLSMQYVEGEYMKANEYEALMYDPTDFVLRTLIPRTVGALEPFKKLPSLRGFFNGYPALGIGAALRDPELVAAAKAFYEAGVYIQKQNEVSEALQKQMREDGFVPACGTGTLPPFDTISDALRGMRGVMLDMYRQPDKLLEALDKVYKYMPDALIARANASGNPRALLGMHRGSDGFLSKKQWETFYWPGYKNLAMALIKEGITPVFFLEGNVTSRLEYFKELPKGWAMGIFDCTDIYQAKKVLNGHMAISGMMPVTLLQMGKPEEVKAFAKELIDVVGKDGGFIMGPRSVLDEVDPELLRVWYDFTLEYGQYK